MVMQSRSKTPQFGDYENQRSAIEGKCESVKPRASEASHSPNPRNFPDEDPPFFLRQSSSSGATNIVPEPNRATNTEEWGGTPRRTMCDELDSTFRSIIDDLTVENRLLRARNRSIERKKKYSKELNKDRFFKVNLYNMSPSDGKELEDILSDFTRSRNVSHETSGPRLSEANIRSSLAEMPGNGASKVLTQAALPQTHAAQSGASSNQVDSGYASISMTPDPGSISHLNNTSTGRCKYDKPARGINNLQLNDIPVGLLPSQARVVTERSKKKMVVRRLEELFTGQKLLRSRNSVRNSHRIDNSHGSVGHGQELIPMEGSREANIMTHSHAAPPRDAFGANSEQQEIEFRVDNVDSSDKLYKQRPTRLRDLDPERQQIPSENVDYLRHLGISTPDLQRVNSSQAGADADGWVYLNLLMNMAQLHIMNVTVDFVRNAVVEVSSRFQLSGDGRRLRWRGGTRPTSLSTVSGSTAMRQSRDDSESTGESVEDHISNADRQIADLSSTKSETESKKGVDKYNSILMKGRMLGRERQRHAAHYSPIFFHSSKNSSASEGLGTPPLDEATVGHKRTVASNTRRLPPAKKRRISNGRRREIVFYNGASFFVDVGNNMSNQSGNEIFDHIDYRSDRGRVWGIQSTHIEPDPDSWFLTSEYLATRKYWDRLLPRDAILHSPEAVTPLSPDSYFDCDLDTRTVFDPTKSTPLLKFPVPMEVSGLGCTLPADHFLETVTTKVYSSGHHSRPQDENNSILQKGSTSSSSPQSDLKIPQNGERQYYLESQWERIQVRMKDLRSLANSNTVASSSNPKGIYTNIASSVQPFPKASEYKSEAVVTRKIIDVKYRQLEPSPQPPPGMYFSDVSQSTEYESGSSNSREGFKSSNQTYLHSKDLSRNYGQGSALLHGRSTHRHNITRPGTIRRISISSIESSGVGDGEDNGDESIDLSGEWESERAKDMEMDNAMNKVVSLKVVGSLKGNEYVSLGEEEDSDERRGSELSKGAESGMDLG